MLHCPGSLRRGGPIFKRQAPIACAMLQYYITASSMRDALILIRNRLDRAGIMLSGLCAVHCLLGIVLVSVLGIGGETLLAPSIHRTGLALAVLVGIVTLGIGALRHGNLVPVSTGGFGNGPIGGGVGGAPRPPGDAPPLTRGGPVVPPGIPQLRHTPPAP